MGGHGGSIWLEQFEITASTCDGLDKVFETFEVYIFL